MQDLSVLIVDDDNAVILILKHYLREKFQTIIAASDGVEALAHAEKGSFDLIISDISMPNMDGIELFKQFRSLNQVTPFIFITAHEDKNKEIIKISSDFGFIKKPPKKSSLQSLIDELLDG